ncbi:hypothetical protein ACF9IK_05215 [Kitasatospora hibisci]|uniref:hypothetical protein n=1 Tax=Kitasatospora hibisci TaxID=3369522 RepID=UPI003754936B
MALNDAADHEALPCGEDLARLWEAGEPVGDHTACTDCHAALDALGVLQRTVHTALDEDGRGGDGRGGDQTAFLERVMCAVRTEIRPGALIPLGDAFDDDWITEAAAAGVLRSAVDTLAGLRAGSCRITPHRGPGGPGRAPALPGSRLPRGPLRIDVEVFADLSRPLPHSVELVRSAVARAAALRLGLDVHRIDVTVRDLLPQEERQP